MNETKVVQTLCCARCTKLIHGDQHKIGRYTYGDCCVLKVLDEEKK